jgi:hypothetical protein
MMRIRIRLQLALERHDGGLSRSAQSRASAAMRSSSPSGVRRAGRCGGGARSRRPRQQSTRAAMEEHDRPVHRPAGRTGGTGIERMPVSRARGCAQAGASPRHVANDLVIEEPILRLLLVEPDGPAISDYELFQ